MRIWYAFLTGFALMMLGRARQFLHGEQHAGGYGNPARVLSNESRVREYGQPEPRSRLEYS